MASIELALPFLFGNEGSYANDPNDRGGETFMGISRKNFPAWIGWKTIDGLRSSPNFPKNLNNQTLKTLVGKFYKPNFWDPLSLDQVQNQKLAREIFDTAVNQGVDTAANYVQRALNLLNRDQRDYQDIEVDNKIGPRTIDLINRHKNPDVLFKVFNVLQGARYIIIAEHDHSQERFMYGWMDRVSL